MITNLLQMSLNKIPPNAFVKNCVPSLDLTFSFKVFHGDLFSKKSASLWRASAHEMPLSICGWSGCLTQCHPCSNLSSSFARRRIQEDCSPSGMRSGFVSTAGRNKHEGPSHNRINRQEYIRIVRFPERSTCLASCLAPWFSKSAAEHGLGIGG